MPKDLYEIISLMASGGIIESADVTEDELASRLRAARMRRKRRNQPTTYSGPRVSIGGV